jgi:2-oxoglutarate dehydrogenase complex dehydrogenase (E1) component-like enzyme
MRDVRPVAPTYAGRKPAAATATGHAQMSAKEQASLVNAALA